MTDSRNPAVEELSDERCWSVLAGCKLGRLVTVVDRHAEIFPINYITDDRSIVFRTGEGSKLFTLTLNNRVAFEIDGWDGTGGWSIIARGEATEITGQGDIDRLEQLPLRPWVPTMKTHWIKITPDEVTGRRFTFGPEPEREPETTSD